jgi:hypothetical protein
LRHNGTEYTQGTRRKQGETLSKLPGFRPPKPKINNEQVKYVCVKASYDYLSCTCTCTCTCTLVFFSDRFGTAKGFFDTRGEKLTMTSGPGHRKWVVVWLAWQVPPQYPNVLKGDCPSQLCFPQLPFAPSFGRGRQLQMFGDMVWKDFEFEFMLSTNASLGCDLPCL